jgi:hypothetical protein
MVEQRLPCHAITANSLQGNAVKRPARRQGESTTEGTDSECFVAGPPSWEEPPDVQGFGLFFKCLDSLDAKALRAFAV